MVQGKGIFETIRSQAVLGEHPAGVIDQDVQALMIFSKGCGSLTDSILVRC